MSLMGLGIFVAFTFFIFIVNRILIDRAWITHKPDEFQNSETPRVSVLVPAYNEEKTIVQSVNSILKMCRNYAGESEVIIVDDGSTDRTGPILADHFSSHHNVMLLRQDNKGKAEALNYAAQNASGDWFMCLDADTILDVNALSKLMGYRDPEADAIAAMVGIHNNLTIDKEGGRPFWPKVPYKISIRMQWLEYCRSYVAFRCSLKDKNCITVVSGACGMVSREMFEKTGGFKSEHLGEDMELTLNVHSKGGYVQFVSETLAWTEAPASISALGRQRVRWFRGALQALIEHKGLLFGKGNRTFKWLILPYIWISDVLGVWVEVAAWTYTAYLIATDAPVDWIGWAFLWGVIMLGHYFNALTVIAFVRKKLNVPYTGYGRGVFMAFFEGFTYHFLYLYWIIKAHLQQIFGTKKEWNKLKRTGARI